MLLSSAYTSLPIRKKPRSRRRTAQERTRSRPRSSCARQRSVCARRAPECDGELEHPIELLAVAAPTPGIVVEVLPPPRRVRPDCLQVPQRVGTDPDVAPGGRDGERADSLELAHVSNWAPVFAAILEAAPSPAARDPRLRTITAAKARHCTGAGTPPRCNAKPRSVGARLDTKERRRRSSRLRPPAMRWSWRPRHSLRCPCPRARPPSPARSRRPLPSRPRLQVQWPSRSARQGCLPGRSRHPCRSEVSFQREASASAAPIAPCRLRR